jgi:predicted nucleotidyltransferase
MHSLVERHRSAIADVCRRYGVRRLDVFGSAARSTDFDIDSSDVDFLVEFDAAASTPSLETFFALRDALRVVLGRRIDLVTPDAMTNPYVRSDVERSREPVYAA